LCPQCLLELATAEGGDGSLGADPRPTVVVPLSRAELRPGRIVARRYRLLCPLGRGGMGEVWRAFDFKLRVEVALKTLRPEIVREEPALEMLRREVRAARQVVSPNVCRVFDLAAEDGLEMISMEYVDGVTLAGMLAERGPLDLATAGEIAAQLLAGLAAIHQAGLVHRDVKPENIMVTASGRVVLMDLGLAKELAEWGAGGIQGTPVYMAPEQAAGRPIDARADVFAVALVLAEMVGGEGPWEPVLRHARAIRPEDRYPTASALARALEEVALRAAETGGNNPYPGLRSFREEDARYFFGRELEVEAMLRRLARPRVLALVGPSGAGKSSFLRAGLLPALPPGWSAMVCTPGDRPSLALAQALAPKLDEDPEAERLSTSFFDEPANAVALVSRWRRRHQHAILIVDQFEELFTLNGEELQARFAELLGRLVVEADIHVLLSLRDDFLFRCEAHEALRPVFSDLTPLAPPTGPVLRRVLVQPALLSGYRFEDERLVDDMLAEVAHERGALPLLAFAAARLWERRDGQSGLLTRRAYSDIGGVGGALARHAEATLQAVGSAHLRVVRELFRNLVTAEGTRAAQDQDEILSLFDERDAAQQVLRQLVDARLLTSFETPADEQHRGARRLEIIHESLLTAWPRLVRWRSQDVEGAQLHDQLRQAARLWEERGRPADLLWTGASFQEFALWRERYPGRLTASEEAFAGAMMEQAGRRRKGRRLAVASTIAFLVVVVGVVGALWLQSRTAEREARREARRAEAQQLFALGQLELEKNPTAALAYALASLERTDSPHVRRFALRALWRGPTAFALDDTSRPPAWPLAFSPDGRWLGGKTQTGETLLWSENGGSPRELPSRGWWMAFGSDSRLLFTMAEGGGRLYALPEGKEIRRIEGDFQWAGIRQRQLITMTPLKPAGEGQRRLIQSWALPAGTPRTIGVWNIPKAARFDVDPTGQWAFFVRAGDLYLIPFARDGAASIRPIVRAEQPITNFAVHPDGDQIFTWHATSGPRVWSRNSGAPQRELATLPVVGQWRIPDITRDGRWLACANGNDQTVFLWDLAAPSGSDPLVLRRGSVTAMLGLAAHPGGSWLATRDYLGVSLWPLARTYPHVLRGPTDQLRGDVAIDPKGGWVAAGGQMEGGKLWIWSLTGGTGQPRVLEPGVGLTTLQSSPDGRVLAAGSNAGVRLLHLDGRPPEKLAGFEGTTVMPAFDREGRHLAAGGGMTDQKEAVTRVWNLQTGEVQVLDAGDGKAILSADFLPDGRLLTGGAGGLRLWDLQTQRSTLLREGVVHAIVSPDGRYALGVQSPRLGGVPSGTAFIYDIPQRRGWNLETHGDAVTLLAWDPSSARVVTGSRDGVVRVGPPSGEEPHLLMGHEGAIWGVEVGPKGRWIASSSEDRTVRLWPMPEGRPFHALAHDELLERLRSLTNYRVMADAAAPGGYHLTFEPFPGWNRTPPVW
jgi:WD40 repeat protein